MFLMQRLGSPVVSALFLSFCLGTATSAEEIAWQNLSGGLFSDTANWLPEQVPGTDDVAVFDLASGSPYLVDFTGATPTNQQMIVRNDLVEFDLAGNTYTLTSAGFHPFIVGETDGQAGTLVLSHGTIDTHRLDLGFWGGQGDLYVDDSANIVSHNEIVVGMFGVGSLEVDGADVRTINPSGWITAGANDGAAGYITVTNGGVLETQGAPIDIAPRGHGELEVLNGGAVISDGELFVGTALASATGSVLIDGPESSYVSNSVYGSVVGGQGEGYLGIHNGGLMRCVGMDIGAEAGGIGEVELTGSGSPVTDERDARWVGR